jgi:hypothetical protein
MESEPSKMYRVLLLGKMLSSEGKKPLTNFEGSSLKIRYHINI